MPMVILLSQTIFGTLIFDIGTAVATAPKTPAQKLNDTARRNNTYSSTDNYRWGNRVYDPKTNVFGSYNVDGTTKTLFSPKSGQRYFDA